MRGAGAAGGGASKADEGGDEARGLAEARKAAFSWIAPAVAVPKGKALLNQAEEVELGQVVYLADTDELVKSAKALEQEGTLAKLLPRDLAKAVPTNNQKVGPHSCQPSPPGPHPSPSTPIAKPHPPSPCPKSYAPNSATSAVIPSP